MTSRVYQGHCHCGQYRYKINVPEIVAAHSCSCEICRKIGYLTVTVPKGCFEVTKPSEPLVVYSSGNAAHRFCQNCGTALLVEHGDSQAESMLSINVRAIVGINPFLLRIENTVGAQTTASNDELFKSTTESDSSETGYNGRCLCGAVSLNLDLPSLSSYEIKEDNCSICVRNAFIGIYPPRSAVTIAGSENTQDYTFGRKFDGHPFCKVCGVHLFLNLYGPPKEIVSGWPQARQDMVAKMLNVQPVNVRALEGVDLKKLDVVRSDEGTEGYVLDS